MDIKGQSASWGTNPPLESMYQASGYDALGRPSLMTADANRAVSGRIYSQFSGRLTVGLIRSGGQLDYVASCMLGLRCATS